MLNKTWRTLLQNYTLQIIKKKRYFIHYKFQITTALVHQFKSIYMKNLNAFSGTVPIDKFYFYTMNTSLY